MLCPRLPYPPKDGGSIAMLEMIRSFDALGHELTVLAMNTPKHYMELRHLPDQWLQRAAFYAVEVDTSPNLADGLYNLLLSKKSYHILRFTFQSFREQLRQILEAHTFDVIQLETLYMAPYLQTARELAPEAVVVLRAHNVEHEIWERRARQPQGGLLGPIRKFYYEETAKRLKHYETEFMKQAAKNKLDAIVAITGRDAGKFDAMKASVPVEVCPAGLDIAALEQWEARMMSPQAANPLQVDFPSIGYIGSMDWAPNQYGVDWFLDKVWPIIHERYPEVKFYLAGRNMPHRYESINLPNVVVVGEVEDAWAFMARRAIMVVPLFFGSGMRVKIVEAMALEKAIVATPIAAEGIGGRHGQHLFLAEKHEAFADCISVLIEKKGTYQALRQQAKAFARKTFNSLQSVGRLADFYQQRLQKQQA